MNRHLPPHSALSPQILSFLNGQFSTDEDLAGAPAFFSELRTECDSLDESLSDLNAKLQHHLDRHSSELGRVGELFSSIRSQLLDLHLSPSGGESRRGMGEELQELAKEVAKVEMVRNYAETALKLDTLVGDIEDAVSSVVSSTLRKHPSKRNSDDMRVFALRTLKSTEDILGSVMKTHPHWERLVSAVDHRVDRALATLRPQAIADHRALLASLGWPPPLSTLSSSNPDVKRSTDAQNPLFTMEGDLKHQYCESFLALCGLQELQRQRKIRQLKGHAGELSVHQPLWAIEELVDPIFRASQHHFSKWIDKPEFIFALVYKVTRDYIDSMDELLQPLVDEAKLSGYSCREEWIAAMVSSLSTYLAKEIIPGYLGQLDDDSDTGIQSQARASWLNLVDLMITFDKQVQSLVAHSGMLLSLQEDGNLQRISSLSVFCDRPDWLDLWAEIELNDTLEKLRPEIEDDRSWSNKVQGAALLSVQDDNKSPWISSAFLRRLSSVVERCRSLPSISLRSRFVRLVCAPIIWKFLDCLLLRCQEAEGLTALTDDNSLTKVAKSINAARYFESVLKEWCEDVFFLEMGSNQAIQSQNPVFDTSTTTESTADRAGGILDEEIRKLTDFRREWVEKLSTVLLRGFDARSRDYMKNKRQWQDKGEEGWTVSRSFIDALDYLQGKMAILEESLNKMDFTTVWRALAAGLDRLIFNGVLMSNIKFYDGGVERLGNDLSVLFGVFGAWCLRPEGFFPKVSEGLKLLKLSKKQLQTSVVGEERWLKENGMRHLTGTEAQKIAKNRVF